MVYRWRKKEPATNPRLMERLVQLAQALVREPATPNEAKAIIDFNNYGKL
jgi:3-keto-5-aminohexanoate cleavage enzyme